MESDKQSDKLSYSTCKDPHICNNETFTAAASRAESRIILQCTQDKAYYILFYTLPQTDGITTSENQQELKIFKFKT